ncbi:MAG: hypothetical protein ABW250_25550 [Pyrinomonadaceae bacterium]
MLGYLLSFLLRFGFCRRLCARRGVRYLGLLLARDGRRLLRGVIV